MMIIDYASIKISNLKNQNFRKKKHRGKNIEYKRILNEIK